MLSLKDEGSVLIIDCQSAGISGDMLLSALVDLGADAEKIVGVLNSVKNYVKGCEHIDAEFKETTRKGFRAKTLNVTVKEQQGARSADDIKSAVERCVADIDLSNAAQRFAKRAVDTLVSAESRLHSLPTGKTHLHETGSADTVLDIVGVASALDQLRLLDGYMYCTPVAVGGGLRSFSHGTVALPAPATLEILKEHEIKIVGGPVKSELTTPTGAALLAALPARCVDYYPELKLRATGYGAGSRDLEQIPNLLRLVLGDAEPPHLTDKVFLLETNIDDASGEVLGYTMQRLYEEGALDVSIIPVSTKKSRLGCLLRVVSDRVHVNKLTDVLMAEGGTLGVRVIPTLRHVASRDVQTVRVKIDGIKDGIRIKVSRDRFGRIMKIKPEHDDVENLARRSGRPLRELAQEITEKARTQIEEPSKRQ